MELRMRLFAAQGKGGGTTLRGWWLCRRGLLASGAEGGLAATCSCWWAGLLISSDYELSEPLERVQSSDCYGTFNRVHTFGVAQNQKQPCLPNS